MDSQNDQYKTEKRIAELKNMMKMAHIRLNRWKAEMDTLVPPPTKFAKVYVCPQCNKAGPLEIFKAWREGSTNERSTEPGTPLDSVSKDGTIKAGCHVITLNEIERIAPELEAVEVEGKFNEFHTTDQV